jgi:hypothetical protein
MVSVLFSDQQNEEAVAPLQASRIDPEPSFGHQQLSCLLCTLQHHGCNMICAFTIPVLFLARTGN